MVSFCLNLKSFELQLIQNNGFFFKFNLVKFFIQYFYIAFCAYYKYIYTKKIQFCKTNLLDTLRVNNTVYRLTKQLKNNRLKLL